MTRIDVYVEAGTTRTFAAAVDWPGWCRSAKDEAGALAALVSYRSRYAAVAARAHLRLPAVGPSDLDVVERVVGNATTNFGAPGIVPELDRVARDGSARRRRRERDAALVEASWQVFDDVVDGAPAVLRKGPRGGGRDRDVIVRHVLDGENSYARKIGVRRPVADPSKPGEMESARRALLDAIRTAEVPEAGSPGWPPAYCARRVAWHVLDHAWEIEDKSPPV